MNAFSQLNTEYSAGNPESQIVLRFFRKPAETSGRADPPENAFRVCFCADSMVY